MHLSTRLGVLAFGSAHLIFNIEPVTRNVPELLGNLQLGDCPCAASGLRSAALMSGDNRAHTG